MRSVHPAGCREAGQHTHAFLSGGVTFCRHVPMRALPFREDFDAVIKDIKVAATGVE